MDQQYHEAHRQPLGCVVMLRRTYYSNHREEHIMFVADRHQHCSPFICFEEYLGVHPTHAHKVDTEVLAYYPNQHPYDVETHYGHSRTTHVTSFPYPYDTNPERPDQ